ncbi:MAG TPA: disulfide bond formation protein B [Candidatus Paceibacterota bacterium]|nr:disulfide bond formation protein B [Candidatus Paceibacterota bacterium]
MDWGNFMTVAFAIATLFGNIFIVAVVVLFVVRRPMLPRVTAFLVENALLFAFGLAAASMVGSLVYSEVVGYPACILCWIQRGFMYPLVPILALGMWARKRIFIWMTLALSVLGGSVALYQWIKDMIALYAPNFVKLGCPYVAGLPSCDRIYTLEFGYVTIAMLSLNAFLLIVIACVVSLKKKSEGVV